MMGYKHKAIILALGLFLIESFGLAIASPSTQCLLHTYDDQKPYKDVAWLTAHNAFVNAKDGWFYTQQNMDIEEQFGYGVRSFMVDIHWHHPFTGLPYLTLCHELSVVHYPCVV